MVWWDMKRQPKFRTEGETGLFADGRNTRMPPEDTVAQGDLFDETAYNTGMEGPMYVGKNPVPVTAELLHQGQFRFNTYCSPCHDRTGQGKASFRRTLRNGSRPILRTIASWRWPTAIFST